MNLSDLRKIDANMDTMLGIAGKTAKREEAKKWNTPYHREFLHLVADTDMQFNTTWESVMEATEFEGGYELDDILYAASNRLITPTQTNERLVALVEEEEYPEKPLAAIIDKTLRCGITAESIQKACGKVKLFGPALCKDWLKMSQKLKDKLLAGGRYVSTPKMDGLRCLIKINMPNEGAYSRAMKPLKNLGPHVLALKNMFDFPCIIDGEVLSATNAWADSISGVKKEGSKVKMLLYIFDLIPGDEMESGNYVLTSEQRHKLLQDNMDYGFKDDSMFAEVVRTPVRDHNEAIVEMKICLSEGWEGSVIHDLDAVYSIKRGNSWIKLKMWLSYEFTVTDILPGKGKHEGRMGAVMVKGDYEGVAIHGEIGTGFKDDERQEIWNNPDDYIGRIAEVKFFELSEHDSLRFPSFLRWRDDL